MSVWHWCNSTMRWAVGGSNRPGEMRCPGQTTGHGLASGVRPGQLAESIVMKKTSIAFLNAAASFLLLLNLSVSFASAQQGAPAQQGPQPAENDASAVEKTPPPAAVIVEGQPVLTVYVSIMSMSPEDRALNIKKRIIEAADDHTISADDVHIDERDGWSEIRFGHHLIMAVTNADAKAAGKLRQQLATECAGGVERAVVNYRKGHSWPSIFRGILMTSLATAVLVAVLWIFRRLRLWIGSRLEKRIKASQLSEERSAFQVSVAYFGPILMGAGSVFHWIFLLAIFEAYLSITFRFFSFTRDMSLGLTAWIVSQLVYLAGRCVDYLPNLAVIAILLLITYWFVRIMRLIFTEISTGALKISGFYPDWALPTEKLARVFVLAFALIVVFPYLPGVKTQAFQGISIFLGVLLSLGSSSAVANAVAGVILTYMRSYLVGDWVTIGGTTGEVVEKTILITRVLTPKDEVITIPNATVMGGAVTNYTVEAKKTGVIFHTTVTIGYDAPWRTVHRLLTSAALETEHVRKQPAPFVLQSALNDFYVSYELNAYTDRPREMLNIFSNLHRNIQDKFNEEGVEICSPHFSALRDGNAVAVPNEYIKKDYRAPGFRIDGSGTDEIRNTASKGTDSTRTNE
jgi:small-conductance mechanosensitive channel